MMHHFIYYRILILIVIQGVEVRMRMSRVVSGVSQVKVVVVVVKMMRMISMHN